MCHRQRCTRSLLGSLSAGYIVQSIAVPLLFSSFVPISERCTRNAAAHSSQVRMMHIAVAHQHSRPIAVFTLSSCGDLSALALRDENLLRSQTQDCESSGLTKAVWLLHTVCMSDAPALNAVLSKISSRITLGPTMASKSLEREKCRVAVRIRLEVEYWG